MNDEIRFGVITVQPIYMEREINFAVLHGKDYLFRLVPCLNGLDLSPLDRNLACDIDLKLVSEIRGLIENYFL